MINLRDSLSVTQKSGEITTHLPHLVAFKVPLISLPRNHAIIIYDLYQKRLMTIIVHPGVLSLCIIILGLEKLTNKKQPAAK